MPGILQNDLPNGTAPGPGDAPVAIPEPEQPIEEFVVVNQEVFIEVNFREQSIQGESRITIYLTNPDDPPDEVAFDARQCEIDTAHIRVNGKNVRATYRDPYETLDVPASWYLSPNNYPVLKSRMKHLLPRRRRDLPVEKREQVGCSPADRSLRVALHPEVPKKVVPISVPSATATAPGKLKVRLSTAGLQIQESTAGGSGSGSGSTAGSDKTKDNTADQPTDGLFEIVVPFTTRHIRDGFQFVGVNDNDTRFPHVYTRHSPEPGFAACIFPCIDDPGSRCFWKVHIKCPRTLGDALMQPLASHQSTNEEGPARPDRPQRPAAVSQRLLQLTEEDKLLDMTAVCSGNLVGEKVDETDETKKVMTFEITDHGSAAHHIGFAIGPFEHVDLFSEFRSEEADEKLGASALKIHGYCLPGRQEEVRNTCAAMAYAADEFAMTYGRYPYDSYKLCFVDDMVSDTVPLLSFSLCSNRLLYPDGIEDRNIEVTRKLVHSLAYQYFGAYIVPNQRSELWLTVGIAYYMTDLFLSKLCGNNDYRFRIKTMADRLAEEDRGRPSLQDLGTYTFLGDFEMDFMVLKAPLVLFILDKRLAKAAGSASASLARVVSKIISKANTSGWGDNNNEIISSESFRRVCEKTSQYQLEAFWNQWVAGSGCPWLTIKQRFNRKRLCVEISVLQTQDVHTSKPQPIRHAEFWREFVEKKYGTYSRKVQRLFTGPMTIRIHEANGTPYEHIVEIREDAAFTGGAKFDIPYNTKYKRLKRNRRHRERAAAAAAADANGENSEEVIVFSLGDRLDGAEDMAKWDLIDWTEQDEKNMDQESYEWIRIDSDFEWIVKMHTNMPSWMYLSQLQQDRDVAAQQDSLLYLSRIREHAMAATILTRTLYDDRYFHGLRTMAAQVLSRQAWKASESHADGESSETGGPEGGGGAGGAANGSGNGSGDAVVYRGLEQLKRVFREFFCYPDMTSRPNNFSDHQRYLVQCSIIEAISKVQFEDKHPQEAQRFLLDLLRFNDNSQNSFSDYMYVAKLVVALATSFCSKSGGGSSNGGGGNSSARAEKKAQAAKGGGMDMVLTFDDGMSDSDSDGLGFDLGADLTRMEEDTEEQQLLENALAEIERYRRMDEWTGSYQNLWTRAALEGKKLLMQAGVIPVDALEFVRYLQDGTVDVVQLKAFEALVELGLMLRPAILKLLLATMTLHSSPFVRDQLFKLFCRGLAAIAFGEHGGQDKEETAKDSGKDKDTGNVEDDDDNGGVIIEQGDAVIKQHQEQHARRENMDAAVRALREAVSGNRDLLLAMWEAMQSPATGCTEKRNLLELLEVLFEGELSLLLTVKHPTMWTAARRSPSSCVIDFKKVQRPLRTTPVVSVPVPVPVPAIPVPMPTPMPASVPISAPVSVAALPTAMPKPVSVSALATPGMSGVPGITGMPGLPGIPGTLPGSLNLAKAGSTTNNLPMGRTRLPDEPKKTGTPKIKLQTHRVSLSSGGHHTPITVRKPSLSAVTTTTPAKVAVPRPAESVSDSIAVQRREPSAAAHRPSLASEALGSPAVKVRTPLSSSSKRKREVHDHEGGGGVRRKMLKITVPRNYDAHLSPSAVRWLQLRRVKTQSPASAADEPIRPTSSRPSNLGMAGHKTASPLGPLGPLGLKTAGGPRRPLGMGSLDRAASASSTSTSSAHKPARKPLPTGAPPTGTPLPTAAPAAPTPTPPPTNPNPKPIFIKFKNKSTPTS